MKKVLTSFITFNFILLSNVAIAGNTVALNYNVMPDVQNGNVIDSVHTDKISFSLFENEDAIYYNNEKVIVENNRFEISILGLTGKQDFTLTNSLGESTTFTYYISDEKGYVDGFKFEELGNKNVKTYIKTINNISVLYTNKEEKTIKNLEEIISSLPQKLLGNLKEIRLMPAKHKSGAAGITNYDKVTFYNLSTYSKTTIENIVIHEIAHTWAYDLMKDKIVDYSYTNYRKAVNADKKFPSEYAKVNVKAGNYSEDFAESVSFYFINEKTFAKKYPARTEYIENLI